MSKSTISTFQLFELIIDEESARAYLEDRLWPDGPVCPSCHAGDRLTPRKDGFHRCNACQLDFTVRTGTIFERSHVPLHKWVYAMYLLVTARKGISSLQLAKEIGVTQKTAWFILGRLREACGDDGPGGGLDKLREDLGKIADMVLNYHPKRKSKSAKKRAKKAAKKGKG